MSRIIALFSVFALCTAKPTTSGHGVVPITVATPAVSYAPITVNSGISQQSRVDYITPILATVVTAPVVAAAPAIAPAPAPGAATALAASPATAADSFVGFGSRGLGYLGISGGVGVGVGGYGAGSGYGVLGIGH